MVTVLWKVRVASVVVLIVFGIIFGSVITERFKEEQVSTIKSTIAEIVRNRAVYTLNESIFSSEGYSQDSWKNFFEANIKTRNIVRIKVWAMNSTIIYSDNPQIIGKQFPDNEEFQKAIRGEIEIKFSGVTKPENIAEVGYKQLLEVYVPITFNGQPAGVIETYYKVDELNDRTSRTNLLVWAVISLLIIIYYFVTNHFLSVYKF